MLQVCGWLLLGGTVGWLIGERGRNLFRRFARISVVQLLFPIVVAHVVWSSEVDHGFLAIPAVSTLNVVVMWWLSAWVSRCFYAPGDPDRAGFILAAVFANITYLGLPYLIGVYGPDAARVAVLIDVASTTPLLFSLGTWIALTQSTTPTTRSLALRSAMLTAVGLPPIWVGALAFLAKVVLNTREPRLLAEYAPAIAPMIGPLMLASVGMSLRMPDLRKSWAPLGAAALLRLVVSPLVTLPLTSLFDWSPAWVRAAVVQEMAMPTMVMAWAVADRHQAGSGFVSSAIALTTVLAPLSLLIWSILL